MPATLPLWSRLLPELTSIVAIGAGAPVQEINDVVTMVCTGGVAPGVTTASGKEKAALHAPVLLFMSIVQSMSSSS